MNCYYYNPDVAFNNYKKSIKGRSKTKCFIFGQDSASISFLNYYDISTKNLIDLKINQNMRNYSGCTMIDNNKLFICGGVNFAMNNITRSAKIYKIPTHKFIKLKDMNKIRFNFPILHYNNKIYVTGGRTYGPNHEAIMSDCEYFDLETKEWYEMPPLNVARCCHQIFSYKNNIYVIGGLSDDKKVKFIEKFDFPSNKWKLTKKSLVMELYSFEIFPKDLDELLIVGGMHRKGFSNFVHSINFKTDRIKFEGFLKYHRANLKMFYLKSKQKLLMMGGSSMSNTNHSSKYLEEYSLINKQSSNVSVKRNVALKYIAKYNYNRESVHLKNSNQISQKIAKKEYTYKITN